MHSPLRAQLLSISLLLLPAACGGGGGGGAGGGGGGASFDLGYSSSSLVIAPGTSDTTLLAVLSESGLSGTISLSTQSAPAGWTVTPSPSQVSSGSDSTITVGVDAGAAVGSYAIVIRGSADSMVQDYILNVHVVPDPSASGLTLSMVPAIVVSRGGSVGAELDIDRSLGVTGDVALTVTGAPGGMSTSFDQNPTTQRGSLLVVSTAVSQAPGTYPLTLSATAGANSGSRTLLVEVVDGTVPDFYVSRVEYGQSNLGLSVPLITGKDALVRAHLLADRSGVSSPLVRLTATLSSTTLGTRDLSGPATVPTLESPNSLSDSWTATVPGAWLQDGVQLRVEADPDSAASDADRSNNLSVVTPTVGPSPTLDLVLVPLVIGSSTGSPAAAMTYRDLIYSHWPVGTVNVSVRAPYTVTSVSSVSADGTGWSPVLSEVASLRSSDGSTAYYYGVLRTSYTSGVAGLGYIGFPVSIGWDHGTSTTLHELGHNFGLRHAPCGGPSNTDANYPFGGGIIGMRGYDLLSGQLHAPTARRDLMSYCNPDWISHYNYEQVRATLSVGLSMVPEVVPAVEPEALLSFSGRIDAGGQPHDLCVHPGCGVAGVTSDALDAAVAAGTTPYRLVLRCTDGRVLEQPFVPLQFGCGAPAGSESRFHVSVPDPGVAFDTEIWRGAVRRFQQAADLAVLSAPAPILDLDGGALHLRWDADQYPELDLVHVLGGQRQTLALGLRDGDARVETAALPAGGRWELTFRRGLRVERIELDR